MKLIILLAAAGFLQDAPTLQSDWTCTVSAAFACTPKGCETYAEGVSYMIVRPSNSEYGRCRDVPVKQSCQRLSADYSNIGKAIVARIRGTAGTATIEPGGFFVETGRISGGQALVTYGRCERTAFLDAPAPRH